MGPVVNQGHKEFVLNWIETAIKEGAKLILDGRNPKVPPECEKGFFIGPTIFDHVTEEMSCGREEIFGPGALHQARGQLRRRAPDHE